MIKILKFIGEIGSILTFFLFMYHYYYLHDEVKGFFDLMICIVFAIWDLNKRNNKPC